MPNGLISCHIGCRSQDSPQHHGHALDGPDHAGQQQSGVEGAQRQLDGIPLQLAHGGDEEAEAHAAHALQQRQHDHPEEIAVVGHAEHHQHEDQHQGGLSAHHHELGDHVREEDLAGRDASHPGAVQQALKGVAQLLLELYVFIGYYLSTFNDQSR